ncbi:MAG: UvrD-helicase domain-containing protein [Desulfurellaceae bacterium]|nr:UvrD-helicase domain-containing protein [Desulfurellaceae bacterium]
MAFYADLHIHSKYSRATSKNCDLKHLAYWARKKGITVVGTGDFTHPVWQAELKDQLVPAEPGLFRLRPELEQEVTQMLPSACQGTTRFMLSVEISTIYKKGDKTRKIHHLLYAPNFSAVERMTERLSRIGNVKSDGRPILGLDSRHLLEITLESDPGSYLVPAHIWTPWFAALGSKSGFDAIDECYADLAPHIFAVETGLSSDPEMNWRVSSLDRFRLVSNSDAHSPEKLGREACVFDTELDYFSIRRALETGQGYQGTIEFFPEEGKYHLDGHRNCQIRLLPHQTKQLEGRCPACGKPLTVGVMHRVDDLADREDDTQPETAGAVQSLVPLPEMLSEILHVGPKSKKVGQHYEGLLNQLGPELQLINDIPLEEIRKSGDTLIAEAISRLRKQEVIRDAGYDGVYGTIRLFREEELRQKTSGASLFTQEPPPQAQRGNSPTDGHTADSQKQGKATRRKADAAQTHTPGASPATSDDTAAVPSADILAGLDSDQRRAAEIIAGPLLIVAGPGSGKTRTLTHRIAHLIRNHHVRPEHCLAITFTRRAADEMRERLHRLLPATADTIPLFTFHALGMSVLQEHWNAAGLQRGFRVASDAERQHLLRETLGVSARRTRSLLSAISVAKRTGQAPAEAEQASVYSRYQQELDARNLVDFDDLIGRAIQVLETDTSLREAYRAQYQWVCIDEYQDVDEQQVRLIKLLVPPDGNICAIGDPDQAIYRFRGADVRLFAQFTADFSSARVVRLARNYRSDSNIVHLSSQVIAPSGSEQKSTPVLADTPSLITLHEARTEKAEAEFVVHSIETLLGGHSFFSIDSGRSRDAEDRSVSFADIAVLYRTEAQAEAVVEALHRSGMPFQKHAHTRLLDHSGVARLIDTLREQPGDGALVARLEAACEKAEASGREETRAALELLQPVARECGDDLDRFLSSLALEMQVDTWDPRADRISLLTLHAAKGLEFPVVFIVGCEDGLLPLSWGKAEDADLEEERRLFYVGVTRAKTKLYLCHAQKRRWRGTVQAMSASPYLADIEEHLLERRRSQTQTRKKKTADQLELF